MILVVAVFAAALSVVVCGGSLGNLSLLKIKARGTVVAALAIQIVVVSVIPKEVHGWVGSALHVGSYCLAVLFLVANRRIPWLWLAGLGGLANFVAIGANGGVMPASKVALAAAGRLRQTSQFLNSRVVSGAHLQVLGDNFSIPKGWPLANVFSIGDVLLALGALLLLHVVGESRPAVAAARMWRRAAPKGQSTADASSRHSSTGASPRTPPTTCKHTWSAPASR